MYFDSLGEFFAMGKHGFYVWMAYGVFLVIAIWNWMVAVHLRKDAVRAVKREIQRNARVKASSAESAGGQMNSEIGEKSQ
jgi:heme exporter protein D